MINNQKWLGELNIKRELSEVISDIYPEVVAQWNKIDDIVAINQLKVLEAFREKKVAEEDFNESSGYGYDDRGRDKFEEIYAKIFKADKALVRPHLVSGTHTLAVAFFGLLRPGDKLLSLTGAPYDTLKRVIGKKNNGGAGKEDMGTLLDWGIKYDELPLKNTGFPDIHKLKEKLNKDVKVAFIQRSLGYNGERAALTVAHIRNICEEVRKYSSDVTIMVDNCYGEFVETDEPISGGADIVAGSLIKNPGGGMCLSGGYIAGREDLVEKISARFSAPYLGGHLGAVASKRFSYMGLFYAPTLVGNSLKAGIFAARLFKEIGYKTKPSFDEARGDIVQVLSLGSKEMVENFCKTIQSYSPVGSFLKPEASSLPGYSDPVIMAAGTFIQGASGELSADAPMREPFNVYLQGAFTLTHALIAIIKAADAIYRC